MTYAASLYNARMRYSLPEKLFFLDHLPDSVDFFIDIGCADGALTSSLKDHRPQATCIGYDISPEQITAARQSVPAREGLDFVDAADSLLRLRQSIAGRNGCIILSSVAHEVFSQGAWTEMMALIRALDCRYIAVRDMSVSRRSMTAPSFPGDCLRIRARGDMAARLADFETTWGSINTRGNLAHFLMKYRWEGNWHNEIRENYIAVAAEDWLDLFPDPYRPVYLDHAPLAHLQQVVKSEFGITFEERTHIKMIFEG